MNNAHRYLFIPAYSHTHRPLIQIVIWALSWVCTTTAISWWNAGRSIRDKEVVQVWTWSVYSWIRHLLYFCRHRCWWVWWSLVSRIRRRIRYTWSAFALNMTIVRPTTRHPPPLFTRICNKVEDYAPLHFINNLFLTSWCRKLTGSAPG